MAKNVLNNLDCPTINGAWMTISIAVVRMDIGTWDKLKCRFQKQNSLSFLPLCELNKVEESVIGRALSIYPTRCNLIYKFQKVQVGKDQEKAQSEKDSHSKNRGGKNPN